jgi:hypothetical protein
MLCHTRVPRLVLLGKVEFLRGMMWVADGSGRWNSCSKKWPICVDTAKIMLISEASKSKYSFI